MTPNHHDLVAAAARSYVNAGAIARIHAGHSWEDTSWPTMIAGGAGGGLSYDTDRRGVNYRTRFAGPIVGAVTWAELADVVRRGVTDELAADLAAAYRRYCNAMATTADGSKAADHDGSELATHDGSATDHLATMRRLELAVIDSGLAATPAQLDLFAIGA
jgi:hypothetical protein